MVANKDLTAALREVGEEMVAVMKMILANDRYPVKKGALVDSLDAVVTQGRDKAGRFTASAELAIVALDYATFLDKGRKPGAKRIPLQVLITWIKRKRIGQTRASNGRYGARPISVNQLAFIIQRSIFLKGIRGRNFITPAFDAGGKLLDVYLDTSYLNGLTADVDRFFTR